MSTCLSHKADHFPLVKAAYLAERSFVHEYAMGGRAPRGVAVLIALPAAFTDSTLATADLFVDVALLIHKKEWKLSLPLCQALGEVASEESNFEFTPLYGEDPLGSKRKCPLLLADLIRDLTGQVPHQTTISRYDPDTRALPKVVEGIDVVYMTILAPMPQAWSNASRWIHARGRGGARWQRAAQIKLTSMEDKCSTACTRN